MAAANAEVKKGGKAFLSASIKVLRCSCSHDFQDQQFGKGMRVHNPWARGYRCTVCSQTKDA